MLQQLVIAVALLAAVALAPAAARPSLRIDVSCVKLTWPDCALHVECVQCLAFGRIQTCFSKEQAAKLSPRFFNCTGLPPEPPAEADEAAPRVVLPAGAAARANDACEGQKDEASCAATAGCVWCLAGAVPPACYTEADAKKLPPAVFQCKFPSLAAQA
eukprot:scaffold5.g766.t1